MTDQFEKAANQLYGSAPMPAALVGARQDKDPFEAAADRLAESSDMRMRTSVFNASQANPDAAARARKIAERTGMLPDVVERNLPTAERQVLVEDVDQYTAETPALRAAYGDPYFAKVAKDDLFTLTGVHKAVRRLLDPTADDRKQTRQAIGEVGSFLAEGAKQLGMGATAGLGAGIQDMAGFGLDIAGGVLNSQQLREAATVYRGYATRARESIDYFSRKYESNLAQGFMSGLQSAGTSLAVLPLGIEYGANALAGTMGAMVGAQSFSKARNKGQDLTDSLVYAAPDAVFEFAFEKVPASRLLQDIAKHSSLATMIARQIVPEVLGEQATTILQDMNEWVRLNPQKTVREFIQERPDAAVQTLVATLVGVGVQSGTIRGVQRALNSAAEKEARVRDAEVHANNMLDLLNTAMGSKLRQRDPQTFAGFAQAAADEAGSPLAQVHVDATILADVLKQSGVDLATFAQMSPTAAEALPDALQSGGSVAIPLGDLLGKMGDTGIETALVPHLRASEDALSQEEAKAEQQAAQTLLQNNFTTVVQQAAESQLIEQSAAKVRDAMFEQLQATGRFSADVNRAYAHMVSAFYTVLGQRQGLTPEQAFQKRMLRVQAVGQQSAEDMGQNTTAFNTWFEGSKVVDDTGKPRVVYHGTGGDFDIFDMSRSGQTYGFRSGGAHFTSDSAQAGRYAEPSRANYRKPNEFNVMPVYLSIKNPLIKRGDDSILEYDRNSRAFNAEAAAGGHDGIIIIGPDKNNGEPDIHYIAFRPEQIKSAIGNDGTYDVNDPSILSQSGREVGDTKYRDRAIELLADLKIPARSAVRIMDGTTKVKLLATNFDIARYFTTKDTLDISTPQGMRSMVDALYADTIKALTDAGSAVGWYDRKVTAALNFMAEIHPEILTDEQAKFGFITMLAITSNSTKVNENFEKAEALYRQWKTSGEWPTDVPDAKAADAMRKGLETMKSLVAEHGWQKVRDFMIADQTRADIEAFSGASINSELANSTIYGAVFLGSKIGAFFNNLYGNFTPVTMDRWFMRTINRVRGSMLVLPESFSQQIDLLETQLQGSTEPDAQAVLAEIAAFKASGVEGVEKTLRALPKTLAHVKARFSVYQRGIVDSKGKRHSYTPRTAENVLAKNIYESLTLDEQTPNGGGDRVLLRTAMRRVQSRLADAGIPIDMADLQAVLWYYEKDLFAKLKQENAQAALFDEDATEEAEDYETAARRVVQKLRGTWAGDAGPGRPAGRAPAQRKGPAPVDTTGDLFAQGGAGGYASGGEAPLPGAPAIRGATGPDPELVAVAERYAASRGITLRRQAAYVEADPERGARIAQAYADMPHAPSDPAVAAAYADMIQQTRAQYDALIEAGYTFTFFDSNSDPYGGNPWNAMRDLRTNKRMAVYGTYDGYGTRAELNIGLAKPTGGQMDVQETLAAVRAAGGEVDESSVQQSDTEQTLVVRLKQKLPSDVLAKLSADLGQEAIAQRFADGSGELQGPQAEKWGAFTPAFFLTLDGQRAAEVDNPMLVDTGLQWPDQSGVMRAVTANDLFRAVHDAFGHGLEGAGFRAQGEENAWQAHVRLFTGPAVGAITSETRGQNSWLNFGPYGETNRTAQLEGTVFADQKTGLMPSWTWTEGRAEDMPLVGQETVLTEQRRMRQAVDLAILQGLMSVPDEIAPQSGGKAQEELASGSNELFAARLSRVGITSHETLWAWWRNNMIFTAVPDPSFSNIGSGQSHEQRVRQLVNVHKADAASDGILSVLRGYGNKGVEKDGLVASKYMRELLVKAGIKPTLDNAVKAYNSLPRKANGVDFYGAANDAFRQDGAPVVKPGQVELTGVHFSTQADLRFLNGQFYGTGLKGAERERVRNSADQRLASRTYFYVDEGKGVRPEAGVGGNAHEAQLTNLYDINADPLKLIVGGDINATETNILNAGFDGYYVRNAFNQQGAAVVIGDASRAIPVTPIANPTTAAPPLPAPPAVYKRGLLARELNKLDINAIKVVAPSARVTGGTFQVLESERAAAAAVAAQQGVDLPVSYAQGKGVRGTYKPSKLTITLLENADLSTFLHETGHFMLDALADAASEVDADVGMREDMDILLKWFGITAATNGKAVDPVEVLRSAFPNRVFTPEELLAIDAEVATGRPAGAAARSLVANVATLADADPQALAKALAGLAQKRDAQSPLDVWNSMNTEAKRPHHEKFAESFEQYLFEGRAPSKELQPLFQRFAAWFERVYQSLQQFMRSHNTQLNDEVRAVFDRMLATREQIEQKQEEMAYTAMFTERPANMTDEEYADWMMANAMATGTAEDDLRSRSLRDLRWVLNARSRELVKLRKDVGEKRKVVEAEVRAEVEAQPVYAVQRWIKTGKLPNGEQQTGARLNTEDLRAIFGDSPAAPWRYLATNLISASREDSLHPDVIAEMFGFESGDQMVRAIVGAYPEDSTIQGLTDNRMLERYGDIASQRAMDDAANAAVHNEYRAKVLASELKAMTQATQPVRILIAAAKTFASQVVGKRKLKDVKPFEHERAEERAAKRGAKATAKGDLTEAAAAKRDQVLQFYSAKAARDALDDIKAARELFDKIVKGGKEEALAKKRDMDLVFAIRAILANYGFGGRAKSAHDYLMVLKEHDPAMFDTIYDRVIAAEQSGKPFNELTVDELRALVDEVKSLWLLSRRTKQIEIDGKLMDLQEAQDALAARVDELGVPDRIPGEGQAVTPAEKRLNMLQTFIAASTRVESWITAKDGGPTGVFRKYIFNTIKDAADAYRADRAEYARRYTELLATIGDTLKRGTISAPELGYTFGKGQGGVGMAELLHAILHTGNASNKRKLLLGRKWATELPDGTLDTTQWDTFIQRMIDEGKLTKAHYDFAQGVWDMLESTKPQAQKMHRDVFGRYFDEVTAEGFVTPFGAYRGGYVPAMADPGAVSDAKTRALAEEENQSLAFAFPTTSKGFTKARVEYNRPLMLDLRTLSSHLDKVLMFSHLEGPVRDVRRLLTGKGVAYALNRQDPVAFDSIITPWLNRTAKQIVETPVVGDAGLMRFFTAARNNAGMAAMFANVSNAAQQLTGFSVAATQVPPRLLMSAMASYIAAPRQTADTVAEASPYMAGRMENEVAAMHSTMHDILLDPNVYDKAKAWSRRHAYFLQTAVDNVISPVVWVAARNHALEQGMSPLDARRHADSVVRTTQGSTLPEDVSRIETGNAFVRTFTQFMGYFNMQANLIGAGMVNITRDMGLRAGAGKALGLLMFGALAPAWVAEAIAQGFKGGPGDEDKDGWYLDDWIAAVFGYGTIRTATAMVPIAGQLANAGVNALNSKPYDDRIGSSPAIGMIEATVRSPVSVYKAIAEKGSDQKAVRDVATAISMVTGIPVAAAARPLAYAAGVNEGKIKPQSTADAVRGAITGAAGPKN